MRSQRLAFVGLVAVALLAASPPALATVPDSTRSTTYTPSSPTTQFNVTFPFAAAADLRVQKIQISPPVTTALVLGTHYSVRRTSGISGVYGVVTLNTAVGSGYQVVVYRATAVTQQVPLTTQGAFKPATHEAALDKLTMIAQDSLAGAISGGDAAAAVATHEAASDPHTGYLKLAGRSGGQVASGGTASGEGLTLHSTAHATKGKIYLGSGSAFDDVNERLGINTTSPAYNLHLAAGNAYVGGDATVTGTLWGTNVSGGDLDLGSTAHGTKGKIYLGTGSYFDDAIEALLIGRTTTDTGVRLHVNGAGGDYGGTVSSDSVAAFEGGAASTAITIGANSANDRSIYFADQTHAQDGEIEYDGAANAMDFHVNNNTFVLRVGSGGLGVGTTSTSGITVGSASIAGTANLDATTSGSHLLLTKSGFQGRVWYDAGNLALQPQLTSGLVTLDGGSGANDAYVAVFGAAHGSTPSDLFLGGDRLVLTSEASVTFGELVPGATGASYVKGTFRARKPIATSSSVVTLTDDDCGKTYFVDTDGAGVQLQDITASNGGCVITVINGCNSGSCEAVISTHASDAMYGNCVGDDATAANVVNYLAFTGLDLSNTKATATRGDIARVISNGSAAWVLEYCTGKWVQK